MTNLSGANLNNRAAVGPQGEGKDSPSSFPKYPAYKDSGVEWLGEVPENWAIFSLKRSVDGCTNGLWGDEPGGENDIVVIRVADFDRGTSRVGLDKLTYRCITQKERASRLLQPGDLLIEKSGGGEKTLVGCVVLFEHDFQAITSNFVARMRPLMGFDSGFLCYAFDCLYQGKVNYPAIKQTTGIQNLDSEAYLQERFCFPPRAEQTQIARFLDHETARIDALIEEQQRLIELLKEKRQAVISHAVTKGLDPSVPMKDSGVEWLGEVPAHWEIKPLKLLVKDGSTISYGIVQPGDALDEGVPFIQTTNMSSGDFDIDCLQKTTPEIATAFPRSRLTGGEVILGIRATIGAAFVVPEFLAGANLSRGIARIDCSSELLSEYLVAYLRSKAVDGYWQLAKQGSTFSEVSIATVKELLVPTPSLQEQADIVSFVDRLVVNLDSLLSNTEHGIELLNERRSALISAAVTGKIDLRAWQPPASTTASIREQETA